VQGATALRRAHPGYGIADSVPSGSTWHGAALFRKGAKRLGMA
jgi:hypothetical protein